MKVTLHQGGSFADNRGVLKFVNEDNPGTYRRFYLMTHPDTTVIRAWQGHRAEEKGFYAISGSFTIAVVSPASFDEPGDDETPSFFQLTAENNQFLRVPGGSYTGIKASTPGSTLLVLSAFDLEGSKGDELRQPPNKWVDWNLIT